MRFPARRHKYGAIKCEIDGLTFHSRKEGRRYQELRLLERAGLIADLELQPAFDLEVLTPRHGLVVKLGEYRADFRYRDVTTGAVVVEDVKGMRTALYRWKKKHVEGQYNITVREL